MNVEATEEQEDNKSLQKFRTALHVIGICLVLGFFISEEYQKLLGGTLVLMFVINFFIDLYKV